MFKHMAGTNKVDEYQLIQYKHDKTYHPDILALGMLGRMKHIVLHLMKYRARLSAYEEDSKENFKAFIDTFIMLVSACNALGIKISNEQEIDLNSKDINFLEEYIQILGRIAKASESADHQEDFSINGEWKKSTKELLGIVILEAHKREIDIIEKSIVRLNEVERNHKLYFMLKDVV